MAQRAARKRASRPRNRSRRRGVSMRGETYNRLKERAEAEGIPITELLDRILTESLPADNGGGKRQ